MGVGWVGKGMSLVGMGEGANDKRVVSKRLTPARLKSSPFLVLGCGGVGWWVLFRARLDITSCFSSSSTSLKRRLFQLDVDFRLTMM